MDCMRTRWQSAFMVPSGAVKCVGITSSSNYFKKLLKLSGSAAYSLTTTKMLWISYSAMSSIGHVN